MRTRSANRIAVDDVRTVGGKDLVLKRLVNHYKAISNAKPEIKNDEPKLFPKNKNNLKNNICQNELYFNVRQTYKGVAKVKPTIDSNLPFTYNMGKSNKNGNAMEKFEDLEHVRRLTAMQKRMQSIGKPQERKKNKHDPISNPIFFFKKPGDTNGIKLVSLEKFSENLKTLNKDDRTKNILNDVLISLTRKKEENKSNINSGEIIKRSNSILLKSDSDKNSKKIYTHIHIDPDEFLNTHVKERLNTKKEEEKQLLNFTRNSSSLNKSRKMLKTQSQKLFSGANFINTNSILNLDKSDNKIIFPIFDSSLENSKDNFHSKIIRFIVTKRIFKDYDMEMLLKQLIKKNMNLLPEGEIIEIFNHIKTELEK